MSYSSAMKFDIEKFDGRINFGLWKVQVNDVLTPSELHKALKENTSNMEVGKWEEQWVISLINLAFFSFIINMRLNHSHLKSNNKVVIN